MPDDGGSDTPDDGGSDTPNNGGSNMPDDVIMAPPDVTDPEDATPIRLSHQITLVTDQPLCLT
jgi:hypothetical protein